MKGTLRLSTVAALGLAVAGVTVASAAPSADERPGIEVIHAFRTGEEGVGLDLGQPGASLGDKWVFNNRLEVGGRPFATEGGVCTLVKRPGLHECVNTLSLPKGQLTVQAITDFDRPPRTPIRLAITGGTGAYRAARGEVEALFLGEGGDADVTLRIITGDDSG